MMSLMLAAVAAVLASPAGELPAATRITAGPMEGTFDQVVKVRVEQLEPGSQVTIHAALIDHKGRRWTAEGQYFASAAGTVDTHTDMSIGGTYTGAGAEQLLCSVLPVPREQLAEYIAGLGVGDDKPLLPAIVDHQPVDIEVDARVGSVSIGQVSLRRAYGAPGQTARSIDTERVKGLFYEPPAAAPKRMPVLVIGGSGGGVLWQPAALLASRGHPTLAVAYFGYADLQPTLLQIPIERFKDAAHWLRQQTGARQIAVLGASRGSEAALLLASYYGEGIDRVVVLVPSHLVHGAYGGNVTGIAPAWTLRGEPVPYVSARPRHENEEQWQAWQEAGRRPPGDVGTPRYLASWNSAQAAQAFGIPVERSRARILAFAGAADAMWPSWIGAERLKERLAAHGRAGQIETVAYAGAGHSIGYPPFANALSSFIVHPVTRRFMSVGGLPASNCSAKFALWERLVGFLG
jgi:pimeloyl-ACP methyl ester carboxylesterase